MDSRFRGNDDIGEAWIFVTFKNGPWNRRLHVIRAFGALSRPATIDSATLAFSWFSVPMTDTVQEVASPPPPSAPREPAAPPRGRPALALALLAHAVVAVWLHARKPQRE